MHVARTRVLDPLRAAAVLWIFAAAALGLARPAGAQSTDESETPLFSAEELEELIAPIALYPDDLVAIVLPASTYPLDVVEAARFLDEADGGTRTPDEDWDDSVVALLNYPEVVRLMDEDLDWTWDLGEAFLNQQAEVFDAIQRFRAQAREAGNLTSDDRQLVTQEANAIRIAPADPQVIYVPYYEPRQVIVHHPAPIRYYPRPYPVYYYPYPAGHSFWSGYFWGVTTAFVIGWDTHYLHAHPHLHVGHPYRNYYYYDPFYVRRSISVNIVNVDRDVYVWQPRHHRIGGRPGRVTVTREGVVRADYGTRRYVSPGDGSRRTVTTGSNSGRSVATSSERRSVATSSDPRNIATSSESRSAAPNRDRTIGGAASTERRATARSSSSSSPVAGNARTTAEPATRDNSSASRRATTSSRSAADASGRVTTREGIVRALRDGSDRNASPALTQQSRSSRAERSSRSNLDAPSTSRTAPSSSRSTISSSSRGTSSSASERSTSRSNIGGASRTTTSRGAISSSRDAAVSRSAAQSRSIAPSRSASPSRAASSSRAASPSRGAETLSRTTPSTRGISQASRSSVSSGRSGSSVRSSGGPTRRSAIGTMRTTR